MNKRRSKKGRRLLVKQANGLFVFLKTNDKNKRDIKIEFSIPYYISDKYFKKDEWEKLCDVIKFYGPEKI